MRTQLWDFMVTTRYSVMYSTKYRQFIGKIQMWINICSAIITMVAITGWSMDASVAILWGIMLAFAQAAPQLTQLFPYFGHLNALTYFIPEALGFAINAEHVWNCCADGDTALIRDKLYDLRCQLNAIDGKYMDGVDLPNWKCLSDPVWAECQRYFLSFDPERKEAKENA